MGNYPERKQDSYGRASWIKRLKKKKIKQARPGRRWQRGAMGMNKAYVK